MNNNIGLVIILVVTVWGALNSSLNMNFMGKLSNVERCIEDKND